MRYSFVAKGQMPLALSGRWHTVGKGACIAPCLYQGPSGSSHHWPAAAYLLLQHSSLTPHTQPEPRGMRTSRIWSLRLSSVHLSHIPPFRDRCDPPTPPTYPMDKNTNSFSTSGKKKSMTLSLTAELPITHSCREIWRRSPSSHRIVPRSTIYSLYWAHDIIKHWDVALFRHSWDDLTILQRWRGEGCKVFGAHHTTLLPCLHLSAKEAHHIEENTLIKSLGQEDTDQCCSSIVAVA